MEWEVGNMSLRISQLLEAASSMSVMYPPFWSLQNKHAFFQAKRRR